MKQIIDIPAIKAAVPMQAVLEAFGITVSHGKAPCPFHEDRHPSMKVYRDGYFCFSCGNGGDAITFIARHDGVSNAEAAQRVAAIGGVVLPEDDYRGRERARQAAQTRRKAEREQEAAHARYRQACKYKRLMEVIVEHTEPFSDEWCEAQRRIERLEGELDELFERLGA